MKTCTKCGCTKAMSLFSADKKKRDGRRTICKQCTSAMQREKYKRDPKYRQKALESSYRNMVPYAQWPDEWKQAHREKKRIGRICGHKGYKASKHDAHVVLWNKRIAKAKDKLNSRLSGQIRKALMGGKNGRSWQSFVGYSREQLVKHLASMLPKRVTLMQALESGWHIDHIVPKSTYNLTDKNEMAKAWCLSNLRLIPAHENILKGSKRTHLL